MRYFIAICLTILLLSSCSNKKSPSLSVPDTRFLDRWKKDYNAIEIDSTFDSRFTITATSYLVKKESPIILQKIFILDIFELNEQYDGVVLKYGDYPAFFLKLLVPRAMTDSLVKNASQITSVLVEVKNIQRSTDIENEGEYDFEYDYRPTSDLSKDFYAVGELIDYHGSYLDKPHIISVEFGNQDSPCKEFKTTFRTYSEAIEYCRQAPFKLKKSIQIDNSSWLRGAEFYSCDKKEGYLIIVLLSGKEYIHSSVPVTIWNDFIQSSSKGRFYDNNIKGNYRLNLTK